MGMTFESLKKNSLKKKKKPLIVSQGNLEKYYAVAIYKHMIDLAISRGQS